MIFLPFCMYIHYIYIQYTSNIYERQHFIVQFVDFNLTLFYFSSLKRGMSFFLRVKCFNYKWKVYLFFYIKKFRIIYRVFWLFFYDYNFWNFFFYQTWTKRYQFFMWNKQSHKTRAGTYMLFSRTYLLRIDLLYVLYYLWYNNKKKSFTGKTKLSLSVCRYIFI